VHNLSLYPHQIGSAATATVLADAHTDRRENPEANTFKANGPGARGRRRWSWRMKKLEMEDYRLKKI